ncbi:hypothetical protein MSP7336_00030 [Mycobacterium shimoidei]|uniref:Uncharacterized protein n=1 Tax=Mycobacterium shimoidei TaxID=29313 RepID=A0A375YSI7_MYCSH|nr:phage holin family protein [Mycobacterium shimoidei]SRX91809.1 hypothetical protein MSP7336_00030 [Mycobacterium shimoidei]
MRRIVLRAVVLLASWAIGLAVAAWVVPDVQVSPPGFVVAVAVFAIAEALISPLILRLPHEYASLGLGGTGLVLTVVALALASALTHDFNMDGLTSWVAVTVVVWLVTTVGAITLPEVFAHMEADATDDATDSTGPTG